MSGAQTLVATVFHDWHQENLPHMSEDDAWEVFVAWLLLRDFDVTLDSLHAGVVDGSNDGGIDAVYTLLESGIVQPDHKAVEDPKAARTMTEGLELTLHVVQAKNNEKFPQLMVTALQSILPRALDLGRSLDVLKDELNDSAREQLEIFRAAYRNLLSRRPKVSVRVAMVSRGFSDRVAANVFSRAKALQQDLARLLPSAEIDVSFIGAEELWSMYDRRPSSTLTLECDEVMTSGGSYIALARLSNFMKLIADDNWAVQRHVFDANVRDFQGDVAVNKEIMASLQQGDGPDFWWLNNGVTILCDEAHSVGKRFALKNIQIVNGLQTSHNLAKWFNEQRELEGGAEALFADERKILVRVIVANDTAVRDRIIRATNRQTPVADASLRATDEVQRRIETYFGSKGLFYDRRKGYYRNLGKDPGRIISIGYLGQAVYAIAYGRPEVARGKPNSLLAEDTRYKQAFDPNADLSIFYWCAKVLRAVDESLQGGNAAMKYWEKRHLSHFIAFAAVVRAIGKAPAHWTDIVHIAKADKDFSQEELEWAYEVSARSLADFSRKHSMTTADATKRQIFAQHLAEAVLKNSAMVL
ncbi:MULTISPECIES: AIPR family protein [unclassified Micromonospora]|uniref:AIPR family protein n=1 Tax=unclassified Micromonospora TaxID=2617518 RepID=UPI001C2300DA|nr:MULTISPECIES: AIPR family protein [unclassified Micromonospora]MBU8860511.1 AIPR family protein [Micromonospora sp. WMMB482]MDM4780048.1 AIPR family protein [Micromonospora sp. b486]